MKPRMTVTTARTLRTVLDECSNLFRARAVLAHDEDGELYNLPEDWREGYAAAYQDACQVLQRDVEALDEWIERQEGIGKPVLVIDNTKRRSAPEGGPKAS